MLGEKKNTLQRSSCEFPARYLYELYQFIRQQTDKKPSTQWTNYILLFTVALGMTVHMQHPRPNLKRLARQQFLERCDHREVCYVSIWLRDWEKSLNSRQWHSRCNWKIWCLSSTVMYAAIIFIYWLLVFSSYVEAKCHQSPPDRMANCAEHSFSWFNNTFHHFFTPICQSGNFEHHFRLHFKAKVDNCQGLLLKEKWVHFWVTFLYNSKVFHNENKFLLMYLHPATMDVWRMVLEAQPCFQHDFFSHCKGTTRSCISRITTYERTHLFVKNQWSATVRALKHNALKIIDTSSSEIHKPHFRDIKSQKESSL